MSLSSDILIIGCGVAGSYLAYRITSSERYRDKEVLIVERRHRVGHPVVCGELVPSPDLLEGHLPRELHKYVRLTHEEIERMNVFTNRIRELKIVILGETLSSLPFRAYVIDKPALIRGWCERASRRAVVLTQAAVVSCHRAGDRIKCRCVLGGRDVSITSSVVVGADSYPSVVDVSFNMNKPLDKRDLIVCLSSRAVSSEHVDDEIVIVIDPHLAPGGYAWIIPRGDGHLNIGLGIRLNLAHDVSTLERAFDKFVDRFRLRPLYRMPMSKTIPLSKVLDNVASESVFLVGDAACTVVPTNGAGINPAMISSQILYETNLCSSRYSSRLHGTLGGYMTMMWRLRRSVIDYVLIDRPNVLRSLLKRRELVVKFVYRALLGSASFSSRALYMFSRLLLTHRVLM